MSFFSMLPITPSPHFPISISGSLGLVHLDSRRELRGKSGQMVILPDEELDWIDASPLRPAAIGLMTLTIGDVNAPALCSGKVPCLHLRPSGLRFYPHEVAVFNSQGLGRFGIDLDPGVPSFFEMRPIDFLEEGLIGAPSLGRSHGDIGDEL